MTQAPVRPRRFSELDKPGRPTKLTPAVFDTITDLVATGQSFQFAAGSAGVAPRTMKSWMARGRAAFDAVAEAAKEIPELADMLADDPDAAVPGEADDERIYRRFYEEVNRAADMVVGSVEAAIRRDHPVHFARHSPLFRRGEYDRAWQADDEDVLLPPSALPAGISAVVVNVRIGTDDPRSVDFLTFTGAPPERVIEGTGTVEKDEAG